MIPEIFNDGARGVRLKAAFELAAAQEQRWKTPEGSTDLGDLYIFPSPPGADVFVHWLVVRKQTEMGCNSFLLIPVDDRIQAGVTDVEIDGESAPWSMVARCCHGVWVSNRTLEMGSRVYRLGDLVLLLINQKLAELLTGKNHYTAEQLENENDPELDEWLERVESIRCFLEEVEERNSTNLDSPINKEGNPPIHIFRFAAMDIGYPKDMEPVSTTLAAAPGESELAMLDDLANWGSGQRRNCAHVLANGNKLFFLVDEKGVLPTIQPGTGIDSSLLVHVEGGNLPVEWEPESRMISFGISTRSFPWVDGKCSFRLSNGSLVVIEK